MQAATYNSQFQLPASNFQNSNMLGRPDSLFAVDEHENELLFSQHQVGGTGLINLHSGVISENTTDHHRAGLTQFLANSSSQDAHGFLSGNSQFDIKMAERLPENMLAREC